MSSRLSTAKELYARARALVQELSDLAIQTNPSFKFSIAMLQLDYILQITLIHAAMADDDFKEIELEFIRDITEYGSVVNLFNIKMKETEPDLPCLSWENLIPLRNALSENGRAAFFGCMTEFVDGIAADFVHWFAPIDAKCEKINYLNRINNVLEQIITVFASYDDDNDAASTIPEIEKANRIKRNILISKWKKAVEDAT